MLRISTVNDSEKSIRLTLEGWLVGPWVDELRKQSEQHLGDSKMVRLDLGKVLFVDPRGIALLRELADHRVKYVNCSNFLSQQLKEKSI